jgi:XTP/dITP diphosphohydrolase
VSPPPARAAGRVRAARFVIATLNPDKLREIIALLPRDLGDFVGLATFAGAGAPAEHGETLEENALIKARAAVAFTDLPAIADDTGLEVEALGGEPGVRSARYAGDGAGYAANVRKLLERMTGIEPERRAARFRTVCVACFPDGGPIVAEGVLEGRITTAPRGSEGFGYDPVFEVAGTGRTLAELPFERKNSLSHRARAIANLASRLRGT